MLKQISKNERIEEEELTLNTKKYKATLWVK
jgi:hypothetical protein